MKNILALCFCLAFFQGYSQYGSLDSSFGTNGVVVDTNVNDSPTSMVLQSDGKIILCGSSTQISRYKSSGIIDSSFGINGRTTNIANTTIGFSCVKLQTDGKILAAGSAYDNSENGNADVAVIRYKINGTMDSTFGTNGTAIFSVQKYDYTTDIDIQTNGKIVIGGWYENKENQPQGIFAMRLNTNGNIDNTFGVSGRYVKTILGRTRSNGVSIGSDGSIYLGTSYSYENEVLAIQKLTTAGINDSTYGTNGATNYAIPNTTSGEIRDIEIQSDNKIVATGNCYNPTTFKTNLFVARFKTNGVIDSTFSTTGIKIISYTNNNSEGISIQVSSIGKIIVAGWIYDSVYASYYATLLSIKSNGNLDSSFGTNGIIINTVTGNYTQFNNVKIKADGKILAVGEKEDHTTIEGNFILLQYKGDNTILPITLLFFGGTFNNNSIVLNWQTTQEINTSYFLVEKSLDGRNYENLQQVNASGSSSIINSYQLTDASPQNGNNYYRIKSIDNDGSISYSKSILMNVVLEKYKLSVYPNPVRNSLTVKFYSDAQQQVQLQIADRQGRIVQQNLYNAQSGTNSFYQNTSGLANGLYQIIVNGQKGNSQAFIKE